MFFNSLAKVEQQHIISAIQFELGKVEDENIHKIMVKSLNNVRSLCCPFASTRRCLSS